MTGSRLSCTNYKEKFYHIQSGGSCEYAVTYEQLLKNNKKLAAELLLDEEEDEEMKEDIDEEQLDKQFKNMELVNV